MKSAEVKPTTTAKKGSGKPFFTGAGEAVQEKQGRTPFFNSGSGGAREGIQTKLSIGKQGDSYEREADMMAERCVNRQSEIAERNNDMSPVAEGGNPQAAAPQVQAKCAKCEEGQQSGGAHRCAECEAEAQNKVQRSAAGMVVESKHSEDIDSRLHSSKGGGSPLPAKTRERMESSLGADFSGVRVHTDGEAAEMNGMLNAHAFTHGGDIYFNRGKYDPNHPEGQRLLAHELTHTVQQGAAGVLPPAAGADQIGEEDKTVEEGKKGEQRKTGEQDKAGEQGKKEEKGTKGEQGKPGEQGKGQKVGGGEKQGQGQKEKQGQKEEQGQKGEHGQKGEKGKSQAIVKEALGEGPAGSPAGAAAVGPTSGAGPAPANKGTAAAAKVDQSRARLDLIAAELTALGTGRPGFSIGEKDAKDPGLVQKKQLCDDSVFNFLNESAALVRNLMAPGAQITTVVTAGAAAAKAVVNAESRKQQAIANAEIRRLKKEAEVKTGAVVGGINARYQQTVTALHADAQAAKANVLIAHGVAAAVLEINVATQLPKIDQIYNEGADKFRKAGVTAGDYAVSKAEVEALEYAKLKDYYQKAYDNDQTDEGITDGPVTSRQFGAKEDAARAVGKAYRDGDTGLINEGKKQADQLLSGPGKGTDLNMVNDIATKSRDALTKNYDAAVKSIDTFTAQAAKNAGMAKEGLIAAAHKALQDTLISLDQRLEAQTRMLTSLSQSLADRIDAEAFETIAVLTDALANAGGQLAAALTKFKSEINGRPVPDMTELAALLDQMKAGIATAGGTMQASLNSGMSESVMSLIKGGGLATQELTGLANDGLAEARQLVANLLPVLSKLAAGSVSAFTQIQKAAAKTFDKTVASAAKGFVEISAGINQVFAQINTQLTKGLEGSAKEIETAFKAAVDKDMSTVIHAEAKKAADQVQPRWKSVLKVLLVIVVVLVVALVVGPAVIGFVEAGAALAVGTGAAAGVIGTVVGGAIVGAASGAAIQMGNNVIDDKPILDGVGHAVLIGALTGALGGFAGAAGTALSKGAGAVSGFFIRFGVNMAFDIGGNIGIEAVEAWKEGRPMNWGQIAMQAVQSAAMNIGMEFLGKIKLVARIQGGSKAFGERAGAAVGGKIKVAVSGAPDIKVTEPAEVKVPEPVAVKPTEHIEVKTPEPVEVKTAEPTEVKAPEPGDVKTPESPEPPEAKLPEPTEVKAPEAAELKAPEAIEGKTPEGEEAKSPEGEEAKMPEPDIEKLIKASHPTGDGHEIKVLEDGRIIRCSLNCEQLASRFEEELKGSRRLREEFKQIEKITNPKAKAKAAAAFEQKVTKRLIREYRAENPESGLDDMDIKRYIDEGARMNPETGRFVGKNGLELEPDVSAEYHERLGGKEGQRFDPEDFDPATKGKYTKAINEREAAREARDDAGRKASKAYKSGDKAMRDAGEKLGNIASDAVMKETFNEEFGVDKPEYTGSGRGTVDKIYPGSGGEKFVVEAKGAGGRLITKKGTIPGYEGKILEQGTEPYLRQTLDEMRVRGERTGDLKLQKTALDAIEALNNGKLRYFQVDQPVNAAGELLKPRLREFKID